MKFINSTIITAAFVAAAPLLHAEEITFPFPPQVDVSKIDFSEKFYTSAVDKSTTPIVNVIGSGSNFGALVIDFNDSGSTYTTAMQESYIWGYRWDGTKTAEDMIREVVTADPRLFWFEGTPGGFGLPIYGYAYDSDGDQNPSVSFFNYGATSQPPGTGPWDGNGADGNAQNDPDDQYESGFLVDGYWGFFISEDEGVSFSFASTGVSGYTLADGDIIGQAWQPGPSFFGPSPDGWVSAEIDQTPEVISDGGDLQEFVTGQDFDLEIGFNEIVTGVDESDLVTSGSAVSGKGAVAVGTPSQVNDTTWSFPISGVQSGTFNYTIAPDPGDIQDLQGNDVPPTSDTFTLTETSSVMEWIRFD